MSTFRRLPMLKRPVPRTVRGRKTLMLTALSLSAALFSVAPPGAIAAPTNDDVSGAVVVGSIPYTDTTNTEEATAGEGDSGCGTATVWYEFTPESDGPYLVTTGGSSFDTTLAVFEGEPTPQTLLACVDDTDTGRRAGLSLELTAGTTYYFEAGTSSSQEIGLGGTLLFGLQKYAPLTAEVTFDRITSDRSGAFTITGTISCSSLNSFYTIFGIVSQAQGLAFFRGDFNGSGYCGPGVATWSAVGGGYNRVLLPKHASLEGYYYVRDVVESIRGDYSKSLLVKRH